MAALDTPDYETTRQQLAAFAANRAPELGTSPVEFLGEQCGAQAQQAQTQASAIARASADAVPAADSSDTGLARWANAIGLPNGQGGYGARVATTATGATGYLTGRAGTVYPLGQIAQAPGGVQIALRASVTIPGTPPGTGQVLGTWDAVTTGATGNVAPGVTCTLASPPAGSDQTFVLQAGPIAGQAMAVLALDAEVGASLLRRLQIKMQRPPNGGNPGDYATWVIEATDANGNVIATFEVLPFVYPNYNGDGSPMVVVTVAGTGTGRIPAASFLAALQTSIKGTVALAGVMPISHDVTFLPPYMPAARMLTVKARCVVSKPAYAFDWTSGGTGLAIASYSAVGPTLTLSAAAPTSLVNAIRAGGGVIDKGPRIYVHTIDALTGLPSGDIIPRQIRVRSIDATNKILTLQDQLVTAPSGFSGEAVFPGGPILEIKDAAGVIVGGVPLEIKAAVDALGPSKVSGLNDPAVLWQDTLGITTISTAAEIALDADGLTRLVDHCVSGSVTIAIGSAAADDVDVQASDNSINGPELLYVGRIIVTD